MDPWMGYGILGLFAVLILIGYLVYSRRLDSYYRMLAEAASLLGLQFFTGEAAAEQEAREKRTEGVPFMPLPRFMARIIGAGGTTRVGGEFDGIRVAVYSETRGSSSGSHTESVWKAYYANPLPFPLHLSREGAGAKVAKALGGQDITVGDEGFDAAVRLKSSDPEAVRSFFSDRNRMATVLAALSAFPGATACQTHVLFERQGRIRDVEEIRAVLQAIVPVARSFSV